jgi:hypothetical protein
LKWIATSGWTNPPKGHPDDYCEYDICSEDCAYKFYVEYIEKLGVGIRLKLLNLSNSWIGIEEDRGQNKNENSKYFQIGYLKANERAAVIGRSFIPEIAPLYYKIRNDINRRRIAYKEEYESVI